VVSNPPYVALGEAGLLPRLVRDWEPPLALYGGADGLSVISQLVREAADALEPGGALAIETDSARAPQTAALLHADTRYLDVQIRPDLTGRDRFVMARRA